MPVRYEFMKYRWNSQLVLIIHYEWTGSRLWEKCDFIRFIKNNRLFPFKTWCRWTYEQDKRSTYRQMRMESHWVRTCKLWTDSHPLNCPPIGDTGYSPIQPWHFCLGQQSLKAFFKLTHSEHNKPLHPLHPHTPPLHPPTPIPASVGQPHLRAPRARREPQATTTQPGHRQSRQAEPSQQRILFL